MKIFEVQRSISIVLQFLQITITFFAVFTKLSDNIQV